MGDPSTHLRAARAEDLPLALAEVHRALAVGAPLELDVDIEGAPTGDRSGRLRWSGSRRRLLDVVEGAGFSDVSMAGAGQARLRAVRARSLADTVGSGMRVLMCGLNPSLYAADAGVGFARPGNRFWPALRAAGLATVDREPRTLLERDGIGMTDLVNRATVAAGELTDAELVAGLARLERLCDWLQPELVYLVGLQGWRVVVDRRARAGLQDRTLGGVPVYVGPSTSGLNASTQLAGHVDHLRAATALL